MDLTKIENFQDAVVTVIGLGRYKQGSGLGAAKWLIRHGAQTIITDLKDESELEESMELVMSWYRKYREMFPERTIYSPVFVLGEHRAEDFTDVDCVVQNPGVPSETEYITAARDAGVPIESDVSLFFRYCPHSIVAVTGTKGKTTTTKMIGTMFEAVDDRTIVAGNIKVSPLEYLDELLVRGEETHVVLELSSWLLETLPDAFADMHKGPDIAVLTNVYPDHLNRYSSYEDYIYSKEILFLSQTSEQFTVLNYDHETVRAMEPKVNGKLFWCSRYYQEHDGCFIKEGMIVVRKNGHEIEVIPVSEVGLKGDHNMENILTSICAAYLRGIGMDVIQNVARSFAGVSDRQELVREVDEITYINDVTATQPDSVIAALKRFGADADLILIAGGTDKGLDFAELAEEIVKTCKHLVLFAGDASDKLASLVGTRIKRNTGVKTMKEAIQLAKAASASGDMVILSPGASVLNLFQNEFDCGEQFREEVRNL
ncbi:UDP-N-acetylmuramoyl-L-alanine--D-glutamate ligase [Patescibacteria group bacterium]|nr:UDP-N-acetylmuramoyl-L-alanine--D-glutamate ligase [Patescibacteria group bacterium]MBU4453306.1 UDP-N-acetylmuramoyl-L-alanine--D-glutamate ligase [Patescibacteria group bacterium]MCG2687875.1 UDP-N-acetylmuramoyl-L-alanine--D-glutamate ligase [Candidatus Parcubacteria bacterium]